MKQLIEFVKEHFVFLQRDIIFHQLDMNKKLLEDYYFKIDTQKAEEHWKKGEYAKAQELYEKHLGSLSKVQKKRLEYNS